MIRNFPQLTTAGCFFQSTYFFSLSLSQSDLSRLGRNRLVVGQLLEEDFVRLNVWYIAIMDNIDAANGVSDIVPMQDLFNKWHTNSGNPSNVGQGLCPCLILFLSHTIPAHLWEDEVPEKRGGTESAPAALLLLNAQLGHSPSRQGWDALWVIYNLKF